MIGFNALKKHLKGAATSGKVTKIALVGDSPTQFLATALKAYSVLMGNTIELYDADIDQVDRQILISGSDVYAFQPDFIIVFESVWHLREKFYDSPNDIKQQFAKDFTERIRGLSESVSAISPAKLIYLNLPHIADTVFANFAAKTNISFGSQLSRINTGIIDVAQSTDNLFIVDTAALISTMGLDQIQPRNMYIQNGLLYEPDFFVHIAKHIYDVIAAIQGRFHKCLILDLDNTTWGGIIGDDGIEGIQIGDLGAGKAFTELQAWAKQLKNRGIILAICSKNSEDIAKEPFEHHPDMVLRLADIAVFVANWETKVDNIKHIQSILNIGFDSMVFLDDNPFERKIVREAIPEITVPELPVDPAEYMPYIASLNLFETASHSEGDESRTLQYQEDAKRVSLKKSFVDEAAFLESLLMVSHVEPFNPFNRPRVAQLTQRSNQFNLRTIRYTEEEVTKLAADPNYVTLTYTLEDSIGDNGLIAILVLHKKGGKTLFIDTWLMSCRVLKRGMENFTLNHIVAIASELGYHTIVGEYIPTKKNGIVKNHYESLGFTEQDGLWVLDVKSFDKLATKINLKA
jgi:FkbH-like protein